MIKSEALSDNCKASIATNLEDFNILLDTLKEIVLKPDDI